MSKPRRQNQKKLDEEEEERRVLEWKKANEQPSGWGNEGKREEEGVEKVWIGMGASSLMLVRRLVPLFFAETLLA